MATHRHKRAESTLRRELSRIVATEVRDPEASSLHVSAVQLSPDKRSARVLVLPPDTRPGDTPDTAPLESLQRAVPFIRKALARQVQMRAVPELQIAYDLSDQRTKRIETLLNRIKKRSRKRGPAMLFFLGLVGSGLGRADVSLERLEASATVMGSEFRIACYAPTRKLASGAMTAAFDEVRRVDRLLSHYRPDSELSRVNERAGQETVVLSDELATLLGECVRYAKESEGAFDIAVGALTKAWGFYTGGGTLPGRLSLWWARRNTGFRHLDLNLEDNTIRFLRSGLSLDPGGIGKGYAVDRAVGVLREYGIERALVSAGTSSIYALGSPPDNVDGWSLDLRSPVRAGESDSAVCLRNEAISTSGSYEKYFESRGKRYGHVLDPRTGKPAEGLVAVSVVAPLTIDTEAWSTALFVNGEEWASANPIENTRVNLCGVRGACSWLVAD